MDDLDDAREIHERPGPMWLAVLHGGPFDGHVEVRDGSLAREIRRKWSFVNRDTVSTQIYVYRLVEPVAAGWLPELVEYVLVDDPLTP